MLAPRNKLWSTPPAAVEAGLAALALSAEDVLVDYGAGDGRVLIAAATAAQCTCLGYEVNEERAAEAEAAVEAAGVADRVTVHVQSALEAGEGEAISAPALRRTLPPPAPTDFSHPTAVFAFLIERGLRKLVPLLLQEAARRAEADAPAPAAAGDAAAAEPKTAQAPDSPRLRFLSVLYPIPPGVCSAPVQVQWVASSELVKTPVYLYHWFGDDRDAA